MSPAIWHLTVPTNIDDHAPPHTE